MSVQKSCALDKNNQFNVVASALKSKLMNLAYNLKNNCIFQLPFLSRVPLDLTQSSDSAYLLGRHYDFSTRQQFLNSFEQVIWFSYRKLPNQCEDVGWGCMIRVIQMLIAQAMTRADPDLHPNSLIDFFRDEKHGPLSLSQICKNGHIQQRWTSCAEILMISHSILTDMRENNKINFLFQIFCDELEIDHLHSYKHHHFPKLISVHTDVGSGSTLDPNYLLHLTLLMKDRRFVGMVSGKDTEALYVLGFSQQLAIILDPHYVQEQQSFRTFFPKNPQGIKFTELASGLTISFYVPSLEEFEELVSELMYAHRVCSPYHCFELNVKEKGEWSEHRRRGSDDFQLL